MNTESTRRVVELLLPVLDDDGVRGWLDRPRHQLGDRTPQELLDEGDDHTVLALALALRRTA